MSSSFKLVDGTSSLAALAAARAALADDDDDDDLDAFFAQTQQQASKSKRAEEPELPQGGDDESENLGNEQGEPSSKMVLEESDGEEEDDGRRALRPAKLLLLERHLQHVAATRFEFNSAALSAKGVPALLADLFGNRNDLCLALQHDLLSAWCIKAKQTLPDAVMEQLLLLTYQAPDTLLSQMASRCAVSLYAGQHSTFMPTHEMVTSALAFFGAADVVLAPSSSSSYSFSFPTVPSPVGAAAVSSSSSSSSSLAATAMATTSRLSLLSNWLQLIAAAFGRGHNNNNKEYNEQDVVLTLRSLLVLSGDLEIQTRHQHACYAAVNAVLLRATSSPSSSSSSSSSSCPAVVEAVFKGLVAEDEAVLSVLQLAHSACFVALDPSRRPFAARLAQLSLGRFCAPSLLLLPLLDQALPAAAEDAGPALQDAVHALEVIAVKGRRRIGADHAERNQRALAALQAGWPQLYAFVSLLHTLSAAAGESWKETQVRQVKNAAEGLSAAVESWGLKGSGKHKHAVACLLDALTLTAAVLDHFECKAVQQLHRV